MNTNEHEWLGGVSPRDRSRGFSAAGSWGWARFGKRTHFDGRARRWDSVTGFGSCGDFWEGPRMNTNEHEWLGGVSPRDRSRGFSAAGSWGSAVFWKTNPF